MLFRSGIETREQAEYLNSIGCSFMQGYYFSRPIPVDEFEKRFMNQEMCTLFERYSQTTITGVTDFWDATAQTTLLFNSFVGGAAIVEYTGSRCSCLDIFEIQ